MTFVSLHDIEKVKFFSEVRISRLLSNVGYHPTVIDYDATTVEGVSRYGVKTYFGDATRPELLAAAGLEEAKLLVVAIDDPEQALRIVEHAHRVRPDLPIVARAYDRLHTYALYQAGAQAIIRETFDAAVRSGRIALELLGMDAKKAAEVSDLFYHRDRHGVFRMADAYDPSLPLFGNNVMGEIGKAVNDETIELIQALLRGEQITWQHGAENDSKADTDSKKDAKNEQA